MPDSTAARADDYRRSLATSTRKDLVRTTWERRGVSIRVIYAGRDRVKLTRLDGFHGEVVRNLVEL